MSLLISESFSLGGVTHQVDVSYTPVGGNPQQIIIDRDTTLTDEVMSLRPGDTIEFRNQAELLFGPGSSPDWIGTPVEAWSDDGLTQNLTRSVRLFGDGNVRFLPGSIPGPIRYVEVDVRPKLAPGYFPLHWHRMGDDSRGQVVEGVVVKNSTNRAFVPHASHGITFIDCIAKDTAGEAWWWNPPAFQSQDRADNTNDLLIDGCLADGITNHYTMNRGYALTAFPLGAGEGNAVIDTVARKIRPTHPKNCSGFNWPEIHHFQPLSWRFEDNATFDSACHGIATWQNNGQEHIINGFRSDGVISHGAYANRYDYRNVYVAGFIVHASGWSATGGNVGDVYVTRNRAANPVTFTDCHVNSLTINNGVVEGDDPIDLIFSGTNLRCEDVVYESVAPGTRVIIDGVECQQ